MIYPKVRVLLLSRKAYYQIRFSRLPAKFHKLRWCCARDLFGSQISVTKGGFELRISCMRRKGKVAEDKVANSGAPNLPNLLGLMA